MALRRRISWILGVSFALGLIGACSLNPQPIPPGETEGTAEDASVPVNDKGKDAGGTGVGGGDGSDGSFSPDDGGDAGETLDASDGGEDASDSGDAGDQ